MDDISLISHPSKISQSMGSFASLGLQVPDDEVEMSTLKQEQILFQQQDRADSFYIIETGKIQLYISNQSTQKLILTTLSDGDVVGELPFTGSLHSVNAVALTTTTLRCLNPKQFWSFFNSNDPFKDYILHLLSSRQYLWSIWLRQVFERSQLISKEVHIEALNKGRYDPLSLYKTAPYPLSRSSEKSTSINLNKSKESSASSIKFKLKIDEKKRQKQVGEIAKTEYFESLIKFTEERHRPPIIDK